ncbi:MAG TPA: 2-amino-4-hydroxy-6-hydroxymethyldihydropteridine diphosphokinase [Dehalococcoidia bacterium]
MNPEPSTVYLGLGSNIGNRAANLRMAVRRLHLLAQVEAVSSLYETEPWGVTDQPSFYNAVCRIRTGLEPRGLLRRLKALEWEIGRRPGPQWGPRPIDLDILFYDDRVMDAPDLTIPHPRLRERAFVLVPLAELAPDLVHPVLGRPVATLRDEAGQEGVTRLQDASWARDVLALDL